MANASLVGANTVNGPGPFSVSTRPAAFTAATSVVWSAEFTALATMVLDGNIAWPPTRTVDSDMVWPANTGAADASRIAANRAARFIMVSPHSRWSGHQRPLSPIVGRGSIGCRCCEIFSRLSLHAGQLEAALPLLGDIIQRFLCGLLTEQHLGDAGAQRQLRRRPQRIAMVEDGGL